MTPTLPALASDVESPEPEPELLPLSESSPHAVSASATPSIPTTIKLCFRFTRTASCEMSRFPAPSAGQRILLRATTYRGAAVTSRGETRHFHFVTNLSHQARARAGAWELG